MKEIVAEKFVVIDVSKNTLDVHINPEAQTLHVTHDDKGVEEICKRLMMMSPTLIVLEATGGLEVRLTCDSISKSIRQKYSCRHSAQLEV